MRKIFLSFSLAFANIRSNFFHTVLSVLGIVIGVGALVAILSFIDGMETYARQELTRTTDVNAVVVQAQTHKMVNGLRIAKDTAPYLDVQQYRELLNSVTGYRRGNLQTRFAAEIALDSAEQRYGAMLTAVAAAVWPDSAVVEGRTIDSLEFAQSAGVALVNDVLARQLDSAGGPAACLGRNVTYKGRRLAIVGVVKAPDAGFDENPPALVVPIGLLTREELQARPPTLTLEAARVEDVQPLKAGVETWLKGQYGAEQHDFSVLTNEFRVDQLAKGFLLFRIVMGLIVGISVLVGGVGVMNVLLISVTERTAEIGLRKAVGANRWDILRLFLSESIAVSAFGSGLGLLFGILVTLIAMPIIRALTELPFKAVYTWDTFFTISAIAVVVGIVFGTYPAMKAARLDPVEALRHE